MRLISAKTILGLSALLLFSCNNEDFLNQTEEGEPCNYICFGIAPDGSAQTKGGNQTNAKACTADRFVLRSADSADTLCVRTLISDGIQTAGNKAVTRGEPVTTEAFYDKFHVLTVKDQETSFFMNEDVTKIGNNWTMDNTYYWPGANHTLHFYAWAPANAITAPSSPKDMTFTYTVPEDATAQQDLIVTNESRPGDFKQQVNLGFKHICTAVKFVVGEQMQKGIIKSVALKGVQNTGTYDMKNGWTNISGTADFTQILDKETTGSEGDGDEITSPAGTFMMLPQTLPSGASVEVVFHSATTNTDRTLSAPIEGTEWPIGKTVTYKLSITPEYELEFISESELQDAHYVIYPIHIKANDIPGNGEWTMTSTDSKVTLRTDLTILTNRGYWIEEDRGTQSISSTATGDDITVYAFLEENITDATRDVELELRPTDIPDATPATFTISQLCPSWNGDFGCERIEDDDYPWGFLWPQGMKIKYNMENADLGDLIKNALLNAYLEWFTDYGQFITKETWLLSITSVTINYDAVPQVAVAKDENNGLKNTLELYNFNGINDVSTLEDILTNWGGTPDKELPLNPEEFAARSCSMKNKYHKTTEQQGNQTIEIPILPQDEITWYLPSKNEATQMTDETYPLSGDYWTSTNSLDEHDNENAFKYTAGGSTSLERRDVKLHVRAVRKKP
jgi:hypothetical protein